MLCNSFSVIGRMCRNCTVFAVFVWGSGWERCSRNNLFRRVKDGGLGLAHLFVRQLVGRFLFFRDNEDPFLQTVCKERLAHLLPELIVCSQGVPAAVFGFYREIVFSVRFLAVRYSKEYLFTVTSKKLRKDVLDSLFPPPLYRAIYSRGPGQNVLKRVKRMQMSPGIKTFFFKLHTGTLSVATFLEERGFYMPWGSKCIICKQPETIDHVFLHCWEGVYFWDILQRTIKKEFPLDPHGIRYLPIGDDDGTPFDQVMVTGLYCIWRSRMAGFYCDPDRRPAHVYFREQITRFLDVVATQECPPPWLARIEPLANLKEF